MRYTILATVLLASFGFGLLHEAHGSASATASILQSQQNGSVQGGFGILNCSTNVSCALSGSKLTVSVPGGPSGNQNIRSVGGGFDGGGSALTVAKVAYITNPPACTISAFNITVDTGTISFDVWKVATGTAIPTVSNSILTGGFLQISTGTAIHSTSTALFTTTTVSANDIFGFEIEAVSGATQATINLECDANS
jgi:hypothetical protein